MAKLKGRFEHNLLCRSSVTSNTIDQNACRSRSHLVPRLRDRGEWRICHLGDIQIIEAHDRYIVRAMQSSITNC
jgi:hypothetical protein